MAGSTVPSVCSRQPYRPPDGTRTSLVLVLVRLLGVLLSALGVLLIRRPRGFADWTVRVDQDLFDRDTSAVEHRITIAVTYGVAGVVLLLGLDYIATGASGLPDG